MTIKILNQTEKNKFLEKLNKQFGIKEVPGILIKMGEEKIFLFQGEISEQEIKELQETTAIERIGVYFAKEERGEIRLSIEGTQIFKNQITKNIFELNEKQVEEWMQGQELNLETGKHGVLIIKHENDFLGCGKASEKKIGNFIPKSRRLRINSDLI